MKITKNSKIVADVEDDNKELVDSLLYIIKNSDDKATLDRAKHVLSELLPLKFVLD